MSAVDGVLSFLAAAEGQLGRPVAILLAPALGRRNLRSTEPVTGQAPVIVSLTSYGERLNSVHLTIESIGMGTVRPSRLILWLDDTERLEALPAPLRRLQNRGLEIRLTRDIGPYKKIIPTLAESLDDDGQRTPIVTADDDILYPRRWLATLLDRARHDPGALHCFRARRIVLDDERLAPYARWPLCTSDAPGFDRLATGVSGSYYPPKLQDALAAAGDGFTAVAPRADDLWTHHTAVRAGIRVRQVARRPRHFPELPGSRRGALFAANLRGGGNDPQIAATYTPEAIALIRADAERPTR